MEHEYGLIGGNIFHGELSPDQLFHMRPAPGYADFTTPIDGLYQCSSATHGGGGVTGIPALLCTRRILADDRRRRRARCAGARSGEPMDVSARPRRDRAARRGSTPCSTRAAPAGCCRPRRTPTDAVLAWERTHFFAGAWVCAGRSAELADAGAARAAVASATTASLLVRGDDGVLRGFSNVCRHRGHELLPCGATADATLDPLPVPRAGRYGLDGTLPSTPRFDAPDGLRPRPSTASSRSRVEEWHGWVMVNVSGDARPLRRAPRRPRRPRRAATSPSGSSSARPTSYELAANWKLPIENYHECFHCPAIHPELCG